MSNNLRIFFNKNNFAAGVGNILEWYDFCLYGYFAPLLAKAFFPNQNKYLSLLYVFLTFASGYLVRPLGGILFGHLGDRIGRGRALYYSVCIMIIPTFLIGLVPDYHQIGIFATVLLVLIRLIQGISAGGQYSGALAFLSHNNPAAHGARAVSTAYIASLLGYFIASCIGGISTYFLNDQLAWRLPFLFTICLIVVLKYCNTHHTDVLTPAKPKITKTPILLLFSQYKLVTLRSTLLACVGGIYYNTFFIFLISYLNIYEGIEMSAILWINALCLISSGILIIQFAKFADRYGRRPLLLASAVLIVLLLYPAFILFAQHTFFTSFLGLWLLTTANTAFMAACAVVYVELFPKAIQYTGCALSYNIGAGIVGGFTPAILTMIMNYSGFHGMLIFLLSCAIVAALIILFMIPETLRPVYNSTIMVNKP